MVIGPVFPVTLSAWFLKINGDGCSRPSSLYQAFLCAASVIAIWNLIIFYISYLPEFQSYLNI